MRKTLKGLHRATRGQSTIGKLADGMEQLASKSAKDDDAPSLLPRRENSDWEPDEKPSLNPRRKKDDKKPPTSYGASLRTRRKEDGK